ncbi:MAG: type I restriction enzyme HsdR N-terminal domain-containing protein [Bacteroidetes bacterium]|nr:type I restriction enzyme HsdR N-terminal domain-containing protein [Bacteroidota bacterium]
MKEILSDVRNLLNSRKYRNEEQVRFSLVARILQKLDWDIWNPEQVHTEFRTNQKDDTRKVDIALFCNKDYPSIFIEIKSSDKLNNQAELAKAEINLKDYNADLT